MHTDKFNPNNYSLIDLSTGKEINVKILFEHIKKTGWKKCYTKKLAQFIGCSGSSPEKVLAYIIDNADQNNRIFGTQDKLAHKIGVSVPTLKRIFSILIKNKMLKLDTPGLYMLSPEIIRTGNDTKGIMILSVWDEL